MTELHTEATSISDLPPLTDEELAENERRWSASVCEDMRQCEEEWRAEGLIWSWIDPEPTWCPHGNWRHVPLRGHAEYTVLFDNPPEPCERIIRLSLIGGGQIRIAEEFVNVPPSWKAHSPDWTTTRVIQHKFRCQCHPLHNHQSYSSLHVTAHCDDGIVKISGWGYDGQNCEMDAEAVVFRGNRQDIADRVAATLRKIEYSGENLLALLDGARGCACCGRPLRDEVSKLIGVGPNCAKQWGIPHSTAAANKRLELRRKLLGEH